MPVPLAVAVPAAAAGLAYLNARTQFYYDAHLVSCAVPATAHLFLRHRRDRLSQFYLLEDRASDPRSADRPFILFDGRTYSYKTVYERALQYGAWLRRRHGVKPKDIVALDMHNSELFIFVWLGLWAIGARPAFINHNLTGHSLVHCVKAATTTLMVLDTEVAPLVQGDDEVSAKLPSVTMVVLTDELQAEIAASEPFRYPDEDRSEDKIENLAMLVYTSGTTGLPKPAIVSRAKCIIGAKYTSRWLKRTPDTIMYTSMPLYHSSAALLGFLNTLECGGTLAIGRKFSTKTFWKEVRQTKATIIHYVGETCRYLLSAPPEIDPVTGENLDQKNHVKYAFGNGLRPDVWDDFKDRFGIETIAEFYAATEGSFGTWNLSSNDFSKGAIGRFGLLYGLLMNIVTDITVELVEVDFTIDEPIRDPKTGFCRRARHGQPGEMLFKLPPKEVATRFQGYYGNTSATTKKIMRDVFRKGDAWFSTGDVVSWDSSGRIYFLDRVGDTFRWKGENVSTAEVAHELGAHPAIHEANVYGVHLPHHDGRAGCAAVVLNGPAGAEPRDETLRSIAAHALKVLPRYAVPLFLRVVPDLGEQTTGTNKQQKHVLRTQGVDPSLCGPADRLFWLRGGTYSPFGKKQWDEIQNGHVKL